MEEKGGKERREGKEYGWEKGMGEQKGRVKERVGRGRGEHGGRKIRKEEEKGEKVEETDQEQEEEMGGGRGRGKEQLFSYVKKVKYVTCYWVKMPEKNQPNKNQLNCWFGFIVHTVLHSQGVTVVRAGGV